MSDDSKNEDNVVNLNKPKFIRKCQRPDNYFRMHNDCPEDIRLSAEGLAVITYLMKKPDDWIIHQSDICKRFNWEIKKTRRVVSHLEDLGYMNKKQINQRGVFGPNITEISDEPIFNNSVKLTVIPKRDDGTVIPKRDDGDLERDLDSTVIPKRDDAFLLVQNKDLTNNNNNNKIPREEWEGVVVCELKKLLDEKENDCVNLRQLKIWLQAFGEARVRECIAYTIKNAQRSPGGFLRRILERGWSVNSLESKKLIKNEEQEDMIRWTKEENGRYWNSLTDETKKLKYAGYLRRFSHLEGHMHGKNILDKDIINHPVFDHFMELEGMDHRDRVWGK